MIPYSGIEKLFAHVAGVIRFFCYRSQSVQADECRLMDMEAKRFLSFAFFELNDRLSSRLVWTSGKALVGSLGSGDPPDPQIHSWGEKAKCRGASTPHSIQSTYALLLYIPMILRMLFTIPGTRVRET